MSDELWYAGMQVISTVAEGERPVETEDGNESMSRNDMVNHHHYLRRFDLLLLCPSKCIYLLLKTFFFIFVVSCDCNDWVMMNRHLRVWLALYFCLVPRCQDSADDRTQYMALVFCNEF